MRISRLMVLLLLLIAGPAWSALQNQDIEENIRERVIDWLKESTAYISCDKDHFIYGVGYIDGSYMERILYVQGGGEKPILSVSLRGDVPEPPEPGGDVGPVSFVLEMKSPRVLYAEPVNGTWVVSENDWQNELRFKYTNWFGVASRKASVWTAQWQGYRRPMLPESVLANAEETCALFAEH